jgi:hypothetical protein
LSPEEVKTKLETLEKLQGKGGKSKANRRDKEIRVRNLMMSKSY